MKIRHLAAWLSVVVVLGASATLIRAQGPGANPATAERARLREAIVKLRTEVEMLQFDYELARVGLMDDVKMEKGLKMAGSMMGAMGAMQVAMNDAQHDANAQPLFEPQENALPPRALPPGVPGEPAVVRPAPSSPPPARAARPQPSAKDRQQAEAKAKKDQEEAEKKEEAELAKAVAERKKELERIYTSLSAKRMDLEDAERSYRENAR